MKSYKPRPIKRRNRTKAQIEQLRQQIEDELDEYHPQSIRHVFYRMTNPRLPEPVAKTDKGSPNGYKQVQTLLTKMRREGVIPYGWITDATRRGFHVSTYDDGADFLRNVAGLYRSNIWKHAGHYVEVWCESRSIAGVIEDVCDELAVSLYPAGGFSSITFAYEAAGYIEMRADRVPAGVLIDKSIEKELREHLDPDIELNFHRIAITTDQIQQYDLPTKPRKETDRRELHMRVTVEAEAMPAQILRDLLREKIESFLPPRALMVAKVAEESERAYLANIAAAMQGRSQKPTP